MGVYVSVWVCGGGTQALAEQACMHACMQLCACSYVHGGAFDMLHREACRTHPPFLVEGLPAM